MPRITKDSTPITDLEHWRRVAGPKTKDQWVPGRSAMEAARYWLQTGDAFPVDLSEGLASHNDFGLVAEWNAEPEVKLSFDEHKGEPRNTDLLVAAHDQHGAFVMAVEAKADETFGSLVPDQLSDAVDARLTNPRSMALIRVETLVQAVLPPRTRGLPSLREIRYQLLTATAGAIAEAGRRRNSRVILVVQEFCSAATKDRNQQRNARDLNAFVHRLSSGAVKAISPGVMAGPFDIPAAMAFSPRPRLYVLKVRCDLRAGV